MAFRLPASIAALLIASWVSPAAAQAIKIHRKAFIDAPTIPFAAPVREASVAPETRLQAAQTSLPVTPPPLAPLAPATAATTAVAPLIAPPAPVVALVAVATPPAAVWSVKSGDLLSDTLREWSKKAGWAYFWDVPEKSDFRLGASNQYLGEFKVGVTDLFKSLPTSVRVRVELRADNTPPLLYVTQEEGSR